MSNDNTTTSSDPRPTFTAVLEQLRPSTHVNKRQRHLIVKGTNLYYKVEYNENTSTWNVVRKFGLSCVIRKYQNEEDAIREIANDADRYEARGVEARTIEALDRRFDEMERRFDQLEEMISLLPAIDGGSMYREAHSRFDEQSSIGTDRNDDSDNSKEDE